MTEWRPPRAQLDITIKKRWYGWQAWVVNEVDPMRTEGDISLRSFTRSGINYKVGIEAARLFRKWNDLYGPYD